MNDITKKYRTISLVLLIMCILLNVAPLATYTVMALCQANLVVEKVALTSTIFIVLIMSLYSLVSKTALRSRIWIILLGMYVCLDYILAPLIIIAICQVLDEMFINPLYKHYKNKYTINREIDKR